MKSALITGITGQDGAYLSKLLLDKGYIVHGIKRRASSFNTSRIDALYQNPEYKGRFFLHYGDLTDSLSITQLLSKIAPHEVYNLAAMSHVKVSFENPEYTANVNALGTLRLLESIKFLNLEKHTKFYQASTSELYGLVQEVPQSETTPFYPRSPYGVSKLFAYWTVINHREAYNIFASNGILFNHESPFRGETFVTRKISMAVAKIALELQEKLFIGNLDAKRDWGYAPDYVEGMWRILQHKNADDFVLATGQTHTVREFIEVAFSRLGIEIEWCNERNTVEEFGRDKHTKKVLIQVDPNYFRPTEVELLIGNPKKAKELLGWEPKVTFKELVEIMVDADLTLLEKSSPKKYTPRHIDLNSL